jgi:2-amino-4-hydroxy-6-hydroxymethyldihydropteridine diphosphokinase
MHTSSKVYIIRVDCTRSRQQTKGEELTAGRFSRYAGRMHTAYVGLGANMGDARSSVRAALRELRGLSGGELVASPVYLTEPQGDPDQPWFVYQVARLECGPEVTPVRLLYALQAIEERLGRGRDPKRRYGPRTIDLDLLAFDAVECAEEALILPHPRLHERAFVLVPLCDLAADLRLPDGRTPRELLGNVPHTVRGRRIFQSPIPETCRCSNGY